LCWVNNVFCFSVGIIIFANVLFRCTIFFKKGTEKGGANAILYLKDGGLKIMPIMIFGRLLGGAEYFPAAVLFGAFH